MSSAAADIYAFVHAAVWGVCDYQKSVHIEIVESEPKSILAVISCAKSDVKYVVAKMMSIRIIAIAIAQRHKAVVSLIINE